MWGRGGLWRPWACTGTRASFFSSASVPSTEWGRPAATRPCSSRPWSKRCTWSFRRRRSAFACKEVVPAAHGARGGPGQRDGRGPGHGGPEVVSVPGLAQTVRVGPAPGPHTVSQGQALGHHGLIMGRALWPLSCTAFAFASATTWGSSPGDLLHEGIQGDGGPAQAPWGAAGG